VAQGNPDVLFDLRKSAQREFERTDAVAHLTPSETRRLLGLYLPEPRSVAFFVENFSSYGANCVPLEGSPRVDWQLYAGDRDCDPQELVAEGSTYLDSMALKGLIFQVDGVVGTDWRLDGYLYRSTGRSELNVKLSLRTVPWSGGFGPTVTAGSIVG
jgi:hypothetical protein